MLRILVISTQGYFSESLHAVMFHVRRQCDYVPDVLCAHFICFLGPSNSEPFVIFSENNTPTLALNNLEKKISKIR
jgi:hypothetical protein